MKEEVAEVRSDIVLLGHTHVPMSRGAWTKVVLNPGSVGQPLDGDPRVSYAVIRNGVAEIRRVEYDIEQAAAGDPRDGIGQRCGGGFDCYTEDGDLVSGAVVRGKGG